MKKLLIALGFLLLGAGSFATAADMPTKYRDPAPKVTGVYNWTGLYVMVDGNIALYDDGASATQTGSLQNLIPSSQGAKSRGWLYGPRAGYQWQNGPFVLGIDGSFRWGKLSADNSTSSSVPRTIFGNLFATTNSSSSNSTSLDWLAAVGPKFGLAFDRVLWYVTPQVAFGKVNTASAYNVTSTPAFPGSCAAISCPNSSGATNQSATKTGFLIETGFDVALPQNWIVNAKIAYFDLGNVNVAYGQTTGTATAVSYGSAVHGWMTGIGIGYKF